MTFKEELIKMGACGYDDPNNQLKAVGWVGDRTAEQAWNECDRGDWMWWYLRKKELVTKEQSVLFAKFCAKSAAELAASAAEWAASAAEWAASAGRAAREAWAARAAEWAASAGRAAAMAGLAERKKQADFLRSIIKFEDLKEKL